jgi:hypothetical protein
LIAAGDIYQSGGEANFEGEALSIGVTDGKEWAKGSLNRVEFIFAEAASVPEKGVGGKASKIVWGLVKAGGGGIDFEVIVAGKVVVNRG